MLNSILSKAILDFLIAFGVVVGGSMLAGIGAVLVMTPPSISMLETAAKLKIWAIVAAVGGSIDPMRYIESNLLEGHFSPVAVQIFYIVCSFLGAHVGTELIKAVCRGSA
ncbi:YtrH family sporulation protein [Paenibacillus kobensis]|uniref:YtrH family sporulation protein n=1 Tax=Paenibacillus kobensis TaxID=59841 RepID=UPI0038992925